MVQDEDAYLFDELYDVVWSEYAPIKEQYYQPETPSAVTHGSPSWNSSKVSLATANSLRSGRPLPQPPGSATSINTSTAGQPFGFGGYDSPVITSSPPPPPPPPHHVQMPTPSAYQPQPGPSSRGIASPSSNDTLEYWNSPSTSPGAAYNSYRGVPSQSMAAVSQDLYSSEANGAAYGNGHRPYGDAGYGASGSYERETPPPPPPPPKKEEKAELNPIELWRAKTFEETSSTSKTNGYDHDRTPPHPNGYDDDRPMAGSSRNPMGAYVDNNSTVGGPSTAQQPGFSRRPTDILNQIAQGPDLDAPMDFEGEAAGYWDELEGEEENEDPHRFVNFSLLSHLAVQLRDKVKRAKHIKGSIPYERSFTGKDAVSTIQSLIQRELAINHGLSTSDRRAALQVARSLHSQLYFFEVEWGSDPLQDGVEDVYMFLDELDGPSGGAGLSDELPTGVVTALAKCYTPSCADGSGSRCYAPRCPKNGDTTVSSTSAGTVIEVPTTKTNTKQWSESVPREVLDSLPESEINRQTIIHKLIQKEEQYIEDLDYVENFYIRPLRAASKNTPPVISSFEIDDFIDEVFGNILDLRECNRRLLEFLYVRQREQSPVIQKIGDIFSDAAVEFRLAYPNYLGHHPNAEKRLKEEIERNARFRLFLDQVGRDVNRPADGVRLDIKAYLNRPSEHLQKYPVLLQAIYSETADGNPDADVLQAAINAIKNLQSVAQLRTFQSAMGKGTPGKWEWHDLVTEDVMLGLHKDEIKRQAIIFELIKGEMAYVKDLENIEVMYIRPLRAADPPIIGADRLEGFITDVYHNFAELHAHHVKLCEKFHEIQREEHPVIKSITAAVFDGALNFRDAYMEYIPNYPIAAYRIDDEMGNNPAFREFVEQCVRHPDAHRLDMKNFINRPIPRLLRYELLLKGVLDATKEDHDDRVEIPHVLEIIKALGKETEPGVMSAKQKVELWNYHANLVFKAGETIDMDLLNNNRSLIYAGKLLRQPESGLEWNGWSELYVLLFDNYLVMTKPRDKDGLNKYHVSRRPIPLDLLTLVNFTDPPTQRGKGLLRNLRGGEGSGIEPQSLTNPNSGAGGMRSAEDSRAVYPCTIHHNGRLGGSIILYAESPQVRVEWKHKLEEAMGLRNVVQESNRVFDVETLSTDTFLIPSMMSTGAPTPSWNQENSFTGKVTCSVPFNTPDGRGLVAIGCAEGVWIGFRHDSRSMRRVLHLKMVTQCAMLEDFGIFLVLADKSLFAYHIEALVPSSPQSSHASATPQKLNGNKDVQFFSVGNLHGRTLVAYMKKKGLESVFHVVEPVVDKINDRSKAAAGLGSRLGFKSQKSDWFRNYREFFLPTESFDLIFLKAKIAVLCSRGFEIMDLMDLKSATIPRREDPRLAALVRRCESCKPLGMFRSTDDEFLLVYDEFGLYVNKHGDPSRNVLAIEWEGTAVSVALHAPYILLFDTRFLEIRHVQTGRLAQIIPGNDVRCLWDGRGVNSQMAVLSPPTDEREGIVQEARVHAVMNSTEPIGQRAGQGRAVAQHVFELIPTIPLYLPGSLASPPTATRFSPPPDHSPVLRPANSYRAYV